MDQPVTPAAAPAATVPASAPAADPVKTSTISAILGLVKPEETNVRPPAPQRPLSMPVSQDDDDEDAPPPKKPAESTPAAPAAPAPATPPAAPAAPVATETPVPAPAAQKKVTVSRRKPLDATSIADEVKKKLQETPAPAAPAAPTTPAAPATPAAVTPPADLTPEEREEFELVQYIESKDPSRTGLTKRFVDFYAKQKEFLEQATRKAEEAGEEYDPSKDPEYKKWVAKNDPGLTRADRKRFESERIYDKAKADAAREAEERLKPQITELTRKTLELEHRPRIDSRVRKFAEETIDGMPEEVVKFHKANGNDINKTRAEFPLEFEAIAKAAAGAKSLAEEFLAVKSGVRAFNPYDEKNPNGDRKHRFLADFVEQQATAFDREGGDLKIRDGKTFVHPSRWNPSLADKHWTFDEEDVLAALRIAAQREAQQMIAAEKTRLQSLGYARDRKVIAPTGATNPPVVVAEPTASPRTPAAAIPGASAATTPPAPAGVLTSMLGLAPRT